MTKYSASQWKDMADKLPKKRLLASQYVSDPDGKKVRITMDAEDFDKLMQAATGPVRYEYFVGERGPELFVPSVNKWAQNKAFLFCCYHLYMRLPRFITQGKFGLWLLPYAGKWANEQ